MSQDRPYFPRRKNIIDFVIEYVDVPRMSCELREVPCSFCRIPADPDFGGMAIILIGYCVRDEVLNAIVCYITTLTFG